MGINLNPLELFEDWYDEAQKLHLKEPTATSLATADRSGRPSVRIVLLKEFSPEGFVFYTNLDSHKGRDLTANPFASMCFYWDQLERQIRVEGKVEAVSPAKADSYFASRARESQIGAWASRQSEAIESKGDLVKRIASYTLKYNVGPVPRPDHWSGFRLIPDRIEFWCKRKFRLHDRFHFEKNGDGHWQKTELYP